jgi:UDP-N-acetylglucosamine 2-epimerase
MLDQVLDLFGIAPDVDLDLMEGGQTPTQVAARVVGTDTARIVGEAGHLLDDEDTYQKAARAVNPYGDGHAAERIVTALMERQNAET